MVKSTSNETLVGGWFNFSIDHAYYVHCRHFGVSMPCKLSVVINRLLCIFVGTGKEWYYEIYISWYLSMPNAASLWPASSDPEGLEVNKLKRIGRKFFANLESSARFSGSSRLEAITWRREVRISSRISFLVLKTF